ncbi:MAG: sigma-E factor negative regulatory protein [Porticoccaceae bacterium]
MGDSDKRIHETLSALMDNETSELETMRLLKSMESDPQLRDSWHRYHLAAAAIRGELPARRVDLSARISAAIADEKSPRPSLHRFFQPLSKVAVAATVAAVAVLGVQQFQLAGLGGDGVGGDSPAQVAGAAPVDGASGPQFQLPSGFDLPPVTGRMASTDSKYAIEPRPVTIMQQVQPDLETQQAIQLYLNGMMKRHTEKASANASQGMLPYARLPQEVDNAR